jgi:hypothetical protein
VVIGDRPAHPLVVGVGVEVELLVSDPEADVVRLVCGSTASRVPKSALDCARSLTGQITVWSLSSPAFPPFQGRLRRGARLETFSPALAGHCQRGTSRMG